MLFKKVFGSGDVLAEKLTADELDALKGGTSATAAACKKGGGCGNGGGCANGGEDRPDELLFNFISAW